MLYLAQRVDVSEEDQRNERSAAALALSARLGHAPKTLRSEVARLMGSSEYLRTIKFIVWIQQREEVRRTSRRQYWMRYSTPSSSRSQRIDSARDSERKWMTTSEAE